MPTLAHHGAPHNPGSVTEHDRDPWLHELSQEITVHHVELEHAFRRAAGFELLTSGQLQFAEPDWLGRS
ncbi:MAG TPA: hypothetical protein VED59_06215 [Acidimicrobiales bacterium]|nr:hypothetical protein [Acidimicrobiales bacterium]